MVIVLVGVAGSGKSTVGKRLAKQLGWLFIEGDDFHPPANVEKMKRGIALTDADRMPWLQAITEVIGKNISQNKSAVIACSALKESYRRILQVSGEVKFVYLKATVPLIEARLKQRSKHFMNSKLIHSQFRTLEEPTGVAQIDAALPVSEIIKCIRQALALKK